jgi:alpha-ketoglutaric semialdehyde dehydrogenase
VVGNEPVSLKLLIGSDWATGAGVNVVSVNPARPSEIVGRGSGADAGDVERAVAAAASAGTLWSRAPHQERAAVLQRAAGLLRNRAEELGIELTREEGKTLAEGIGEVRRAADVLDFNASVANTPNGEIYSSPRPDEFIMAKRRPVGIVGVITPFNFPIAIPAWKIAPALSFGNTVVWKPASSVPVLAQRLAEILLEAGLPDGVLNLLIGPPAIGQAVAAHPAVSAVTFTGSTAVGRGLIAACGAHAKPVQAEMGGKNAAIVFADADLDLAVAEVLNSAFRSSAQRCTAASRLLVHDSIADEFLAEMAKRTDSMVGGNPLADETALGPVITPSAQADIEQAITHGEATATRLSTRRAIASTGGGYFVPPSVFQTSDTAHELWRTEVFGPVLCAVQFSSVDEAIHLTNDCEFGLSGAVFTRDLRITMRAMNELDVGILHVNSETGGADPHVPFGGAKASGFGPKEQGFAARDFYTSLRTTYVRSTDRREETISGEASHQAAGRQQV